MSDQQQQQSQHSREGETLQPTLPVQGHSSRSRPSSQAPVPSIEHPDLAQRQSPSTASQSQTSYSPSRLPQFAIPQSPRSLPGEPSQKAAKVAIPRLKRSSETGGEDASRSGGRHRVNHACEPCRHRKTKCSGERPVCRHCQDFKIACFYADGKRDRVKK